MPLVGNLHKLVWGGRLFETESWSCSLHFIAPATVLDDPAIFAPALIAWLNRADSNLSNGAWLDWVKINQVDPATADYVDQGESHTHFLPTPEQGLATASLPQATLAVSTVTAKQRGRASKGRFFPPSGASHPVGADGRISAFHAGLEAASAAQLITDLNGSADGECYVWSQIGQLQEEITACRVGRVVDTQRRRRRGLVEEYETTPVS